MAFAPSLRIRLISVIDFLFPVHSANYNKKPYRLIRIALGQRLPSHGFCGPSPGRRQCLFPVAVAHARRNSSFKHREQRCLCLITHSEGVGGKPLHGHHYSRRIIYLHHGFWRNSNAPVRPGRKARTDTRRPSMATWQVNSLATLRRTRRKSSGMSSSPPARVANS